MRHAHAPQFLERFVDIPNSDPAIATPSATEGNNTKTQNGEEREENKKKREREKKKRERERECVCVCAGSEGSEGSEVELG